MRNVRLLATVALGLALGSPPAAAQTAPRPWPVPEWATREPSPAVNRDALAAALDSAMSNPEATRALLVVEDGAIIGERYAPGYSASTRFFSYSMAKSFTATLVGILVGQGRLDVDAPAPVPEWSEPGDPRGDIRLSDMLHMSSGIGSDELLDAPSSDVMTMLFGTGRHDVAHHAADHPLKYTPGTFWSYSNSTTNVISGVVRRTVGNTEADYRRFMDEALFEPLGMSSVVAGFDDRGTFVGSSYISASARDYARLGLLYLRGGEWNGRRILPESWVKFVRTPAPDSNGRYGGHFWLGPGTGSATTPGAQGPAVRWPDGVYSAFGLYGQFISISPSQRLVVVILGHTQFAPEKDRATYRIRQLESIFNAVNVPAAQHRARETRQTSAHNQGE